MATVGSQRELTPDISHLTLGYPHISTPRRRGGGVGAVFAVVDAAVVIASGMVAYSSREMLGRWFGVRPIDLNSLPHARLFGYLVMYAVLAVVCNAAQDLYSDELIHASYVAKRRILKALLLSSLLAIMVAFVSGEMNVPRLMFASTVLLTLAGELIVRYTSRHYYLRRVEKGIGTQHVLVVGGGPVAEAFRAFLETHAQFGKIFCGFVDPNPNSSARWLGPPEDLPRILTECFIDEIYIVPGIGRELVMQIALDARERQIGVRIVPDLYDGLAVGAATAHVGPFPVLELNRQPIPAFGLLLKRLMDIAISVATLVVMSPVMLLAALAIKLDTPGPVLYAAWRVGRKGRKFRCYKFRTMVADADAHKEKLRHMNEREGATFKIANDPRITTVGHFLRKYSIDELPQLFNVLKGEMSIVGPRPHPVDDYNHYGLEDLRRLDVLPGITGLWQVSARRDPSFQKNVLLDLEYIENWNIFLDIRILFRTLPEVFGGSGH